MNSLRIHVEHDLTDPRIFHVWRREKASQYGPSKREQWTISGKDALVEHISDILQPTLGRAVLFDETRITGGDEELEWWLNEQIIY